MLSRRAKRTAGHGLGRELWGLEECSVVPAVRVEKLARARGVREGFLGEVTHE